MGSPSFLAAPRAGELKMEDKTRQKQYLLYLPRVDVKARTVPSCPPVLEHT